MGEGREKGREHSHMLSLWKLMQLKRASGCHSWASRPWSLRAKGPGVQSELRELTKPSYKRLLQTDSSTFTAWVSSFCWNLGCVSACTWRSHFRWPRTYLQKYFSTNNRKMVVDEEGSPRIIKKCLGGFWFCFILKFQKVNKTF